VIHSVARTTPTSQSVTDETLRRLTDELIRVRRRRDVGDPAMVLDGSAFKILWLLVDHGPHTLRALADHLQLEQSTINRQVKSVLARGLAQRHSQPGSAGKVITATPAGELAYRHDADLRREGLRTVVAGLGERTTADLAVGLAALNDAIDRAIESAGHRRP
jgi:DNA-binding MarR family transcriptional regulator